MATLTQHVLSATLALMVLFTGFAGRAGVQVVNEATAQRLFRLHPHNVPGEQLYIETYGEPAPFVPEHCHDDPNLTTSHTQPDPNEVQAAASLAGSMLCNANLVLPDLPANLVSLQPGMSSPLLTVYLLPASPPPQS